ncbi:MAG: tetratricopeptide repeat protein [Pricia sp.]
MTLAETNWDLADFYRTASFADSAYYHYSEAQKIYQLLKDDKNNAIMLNNMAIVQADIKDYTGSEITTIRAIEILKPIEDYQQLYTSYNNLGSVAKELKEYDRSLEYYQEALNYLVNLENSSNLELDTKNNIGMVYQEQGNYEESIAYYEEVLSDKSLQKIYPEEYATVIGNLAYSKSVLNKDADLSNQFTKAIQIQDSLNDAQRISLTHYYFSEYYLDRRDTQQALTQANEALKYAKKANNNERILRTLQLLTRVNPQNSSAYNQRYITLNDSLQEEERQVRDKFARIRFETDEYIAENETLASEKQLWTGIAFTIFLLGGSAVVIFNQRSKNQKLRFQQAQQAANQEIFNLMLAQKEKEEEGKKAEQKRISEELHDGVLGRMMGSRMVLTGLNQKSDQEAELQRKKAIDALQEVEKEIRDISHELSHSAYRKMQDLMLSLQDLMKTIENGSNIKCHLVYDEQKDWDALKGEIKINVYRMIQEIIQNSVKHAQCQNATVTFALDNDILKIDIADDGKGFSTKRRKKGIGMRNISSRMEKLNGKWHIDSVPGKGTTVALRIPITCSKSSKPVSRNPGKPQLADQV